MMVKNCDQSVRMNNNANALNISDHRYGIFVINNQILIRFICTSKIDSRQNCFSRKEKVEIKKLKNPKEFINY